MLTTEEEAKTKRCQESFNACFGVSPQGQMYPASSPFGHGYSGGTYAMVTAPSMCIGSACMAWRWHQQEFISGMLQAIEMQDHGGAPPQPLGYCGKAGKP